MSKTYMFTNPINCHGCRVMEPIIAENQLNVEILDVNTEHGASMAMAYNVRGGLPMFIRINEDGVVANTWSGTLTLETLEIFIRG